MTGRLLDVGKLARVIALLTLVAAFSWVSCCPNTWSVFEWRYRYRVRVGMTLGEAEAVLGPATKQASPPTLQPDKPAVQGSEFYFWSEPGAVIGGAVIWVGLRDGRICDKWFSFPSF
jgi:hypothetical protein